MQARAKSAPNFSFPNVKLETEVVGSDETVRVKICTLRQASRDLMNLCTGLCNRQSRDKFRWTHP